MLKQITPRQIFAFTLLVSAGLVGGGLVLAKTLNLAACPLCIIQRMLYMALALSALAGFCLPRCKLSQTLAAIICTATADLGAFVAGYQVWLQRFAKDVSCTANAPWWEEFVYWAGEKIPQLFEATGLCSEAGWKFLGLAIADWSLLAFSTLGLISVLALIKTLHRD